MFSLPPSNCRPLRSERPDRGCLITQNRRKLAILSLLPPRCVFGAATAVAVNYPVVRGRRRASPWPRRDHSPLRSEKLRKAPSLRNEEKRGRTWISKDRIRGTRPSCPSWIDFLSCHSEWRIRLFDECRKISIKDLLTIPPRRRRPMMTKVSAALIRLCHRNRVVEGDPPLLALLLADLGQPQNHSAAAIVAETAIRLSAHQQA